MTHTVHLHLEETDNLALQRLCGSFDNNLDLLAKALDIHISRRFEHFTFNGAFAHAGKRALLKLLETAQTRDLNDGDIRLAAVEAQTEDAGHQEKTMTTPIISAPSAAASAAERHGKTAISAPCSTTTSYSVSGRQVRAKPISPLPPPSMRWKNTKSNASF